METELTGRWSQVADELEAFRLGIAGAIRVRRHRLGTAAFRTYQVSRNLARDKENASLLPHIDAIAARRASASAGRRRSPPPQPRRERSVSHGRTGRAAARPVLSSA